MTPRAIERAVARALATLDPRARVHDALGKHPPDRLPAKVLAIGKAAPAMAAGALDRWGDEIAATLVIAPRGTDAKEIAKRGGVTVIRAAHPVPDESSVKAAEAALDFVHTNYERHAILVLISGGASALVCKPIVSLEAKQIVTRALLASGAPIQDINVVRKHLSRIKGGGLVRAAHPNRVHTLVVSDVINGTPTMIGSGPSVADPTQARDARRIVRKWAPEVGNVRLADTLRPNDRRAAFATAEIVVSPEDLARAVADALRPDVFRVKVLPSSQEDAETLAKEYASIVARPRDGDHVLAYVRAAEPAVSVTKKKSRGGRCTHVATLVARALAGTSHAFTFAALATDGVDGMSGTAGAIVTQAFAKRIGIDALDRALATFDTGSLHRESGTALAESPSGQNLADLHVLVV